MRLYLFVICVVLSVSSLRADHLIITTKGNSVVIGKSKKKGETLVFVPRAGGKAQQLPVKDIAVIIPVVTPGKEYKLQDVTSALEKISEARPDHVRARKNLNLIETEWYTLKRSMTSDVGKKIKYEMNRFRRSKTTSSLNTAILNLEMLKLKYSKDPKDVALVEEAMDDLKEAYLGIDVDAFIEETKATKMTLPAFAKMKHVAVGMMEKQGFEKEKKAINAALDGAREDVLKTYGPYAKKTFSSKSSLDSYLKGKTILVALLNDVASTSAQKSSLEAQIEAFDALAKAKLGKIDFSHNGFPLLESDLKMLATLRDYSSVTHSKHIKVSEEIAYLVPLKEPVVVAGDSGGASMPFNVVMKITDLNPKEYGVMVVGVQFRRILTHYMPMPTLKVRSGRARVPFRCTFQSMRGDVKPVNDDEGSCIMLYLVKRDPGDGDKADDKGWSVVSKGCRLPWPDDY